MIDVELPCKPWVANYLQMMYGNPVMMTRKSFLGKYFYRLLSDGDSENDKRTYGYIKSNYPTLLRVTISERAFMRKGFVLTPTLNVEFNDAVEQLIKEHMLNFVFAAVKVGGTKKTDAYNAFVTEFKLNPEVFNLEFVKKNVERSGVLTKNPKLTLNINHKKTFAEK